MDIKPIRGGQDYERALRRVEELWDPPEGSAESDELDVLATLIEAYERGTIQLICLIPSKQLSFVWNRRARTPGR